MSLLFLEDEGDSLRESLKTKSRDVLLSYAYSAEQYEKEKTGKPKFGGVHDYLNINESELIDYILRKNQVYPELTVEKLNQLVTKYGLDKEAQVTKREEEVLESIPMVTSFTEPLDTFENPQVGGGLIDFIFREDREQLEKWGLAVRTFEISKMMAKIGFPALHGFIESLNNYDLAMYIVNMAQQYPELASATALDKYTREFGFDN
jgi:hypothetical protein